MLKEVETIQIKFFLIHLFMDGYVLKTDNTGFFNVIWRFNKIQNSCFWTVGLAARLKKAPVEMEMILMGWIVIRAKSDSEKAAAAAMDRSQKVAVGALVLPVFDDAYASPVLQPKARYINRIGRCVLASNRSPLLVAYNIAARVGTHLFDTANSCAKDLAGGGLYNMCHPHCESRGEFAGGCAGGNLGVSCFDNSYSIVPAAAVSHRLIEYGAGINIRWL